MKKAILKLCFLILITTFLVTEISVVNGAEKNDLGVVELFEKVDDFNGAVYNYNLNDFFEKGEIRYVSYEIVAAPLGKVVSLADNVLTVAPDKNFKGNVKIRATDRNGEFSYITFKLKFINATEYVEKALLFVQWVIILALLLLVVLSLFAYPVGKGEILFKDIDGKTIGSIQLDKGFRVFSRAVRKTIPASPVKGFFISRGECLKFIPAKGKAVYIKNKVKGRESIIKITSYPLYQGEEYATIFYTDRTCSEGVKINFR